MSLNDEHKNVSLFVFCSLVSIVYFVYLETSKEDELQVLLAILLL